MLKLKSVLCVIVVLGLQFPVIAQNNTDSPYSRYGYGLLANPSSSAGIAMGGIGYGLRSSNQINPLNPASYSSVDSLTFLLDIGAEFQMSWYQENGIKQKNYNGNIINVNMLFPISKKLAFSAGFLPVTYVGYNYGFVETIGSLSYQESFAGTGGFQQVYGGLSYKPFKNLSIGANVGYLFGDINHTSSTVFLSETNANTSLDSIKIRAHDLIYTVGVQYTQPLSKDYSLTIGGAYTPKINLTANERHIHYMGSVVDDDKTTSSNGFDLAQSIGGGLSFVKKNKYLIGADVLYQDWADAQYQGKTDTLKNRFRFSAGGEFIPDARSRKYFNRIQYRLGGYYSNSYFETKNGMYKEFGASVGFGLPVYNKSVLQVSFDYVKVKPDQPQALDEQYFKVTLNFTFNETWFRKWRLN